MKRHFRILPLLVIVAGLSFSIRVGEFFHGLQNMGSAYAQSEDAGMDNENSDLVDLSSVLEPELEEVPPAFSEDAGGEEVVWQDSYDEDIEYSEVKAELYQDLSNRRQELDKRERELGTREALLKAAERELDQKLRELNIVKDEITLLLQEQSEEERKRIQSLVKIYEGMKAKDAARIFNTLDMDVLLNVISRMSERKSAPILAEMNPERARSVTILLAEQKQLPVLSSQ
jgi:flagellar motility protein MotE (MotC chaperone)